MDPRTLEIQNVISSSGNYNLWVYDNIKNYLEGDVLDLGSGIGNVQIFFTKNKNIKKIFLSDIAPDMIDSLNMRFSGFHNCAVIRCDMEENNFARHLPFNRVDTVSAINVLEHVNNDVLALQNIYTILKDDGRAVLVTPALTLIHGTLDEISGHYRRYTKKSLNVKIKAAGFIIKKQYYFNFFGIFTWFLAGKVLKQRSFDKNACGILDKCVPALEIMEKIIIPPAGQTLVTICQKNA